MPPAMATTTTTTSPPQSAPPLQPAPSHAGYELDNTSGRPWLAVNNNDASGSSTGSNANNSNTTPTTAGLQAQPFWQHQQPQPHSGEAGLPLGTTASELYGLANVEPNPHLYVHNVPKEATETELRDLFSTFGTVERIRLKVNQKVGPHALYAFVTYSTTAEAELALCRLNGYDIRGRKLRIEFQRNNSRGRAQQADLDGGNSTGSVGRHHPDDNNNYQPPFTQQSAVAPPLKRPRVSSDVAATVLPAQRATAASHHQYMPLRWPPPGSDEPPQLQQQSQPPFTQSLQLPTPQSSSVQPPAGNQAPPQSLYTPPYIVNLFGALQQAKPQLFSQPHPLATPAPPEGGRELWRVPPQGPILGSVARNNKRRVNVTLHPIFGPMPANGELFNISHRGTIEDVLKRVVSAAALVTLASTASPPNAPVASDLALRSFSEHVSYLNSKKRAGVVTDAENRFTVYLVPPGLPLFDTYTAQLRAAADLVAQSIYVPDEHPVCLVALFVAPSTAAPINSANLAPAPTVVPVGGPSASANAGGAPSRQREELVEELLPAAAEPPEPGEVVAVGATDQQQLSSVALQPSG